MEGPMGAMRKAGIWLGLVEDEDERLDGGYDDEYGEPEDFVPPVRPRPLARQTTRGHEAPAERELRLSERVSERAYARGRERDDDGDLRSGREVHPHAGRELYRDTPREHAQGDLRVRTEEPRVAEPRVADARLAERATERTSERVDLRGSESRLNEARTASVRPLTRPASAGATSFPTQDNLALAPQVQLRERAVVSDERSSRKLQITTLHPTSFNEARAIGEHFRDGHPVIMNLTEMDEPDARRLVDFAAGLAFGLRGSMDRVTNRVFLLSPENIKVSAEDKARIAEGGFFDQG
jgi:cell division inhibitor SepF